jgi:hypothetical protein
MGIDPFQQNFSLIIVKDKIFLSLTQTRRIETISRVHSLKYIL